MPASPSPDPLLFELQGEVFMEADPIRNALTWAATTVITWVVVLSVGLLLVRMATTGRLFPQDDPITERDEPTPDDAEGADPRDAPAVGP